MLYPGPNSHGYFQLVINTFSIWLPLDLVHFKSSSQKHIIKLTLLVATNNSTTNHSTVLGPISLPTITITTYLSLSLMKCVSLKPELNPENLSYPLCVFIFTGCCMLQWHRRFAKQHLCRAEFWWNAWYFFQNCHSESPSWGRGTGIFGRLKILVFKCEERRFGVINSSENRRCEYGQFEHVKITKYEV